MIHESLVTTVDHDRNVNLAPMGMVTDERFSWSDPQGQVFQLRPFEPSRTLDNLRAHGKGVLQFIDDVLLIARAALNDVLVERDLFDGSNRSLPYLKDACSIYEFQVQSMMQEQNRWYINCQILNWQNLRPFPGYNRAQYAVIEATILATRLDWIPLEVVRRQVEEGHGVVGKTGGPREQEAWQFVCQWIESRSEVEL